MGEGGKRSWTSQEVSNGFCGGGGGGGGGGGDDVSQRLRR